MDDQFPDEEDGENKRGGGGVALLGGVGRFYGWPSSRIVRVSRASGGKDRHSKVLTSKGLRDRRMRLSVNTAIQFYDLQDRLGYDQPSKAVEWLLKAAASSIAELPPMNSPFPDTPKQLSYEKRTTDAGSDQLGFGLVDMDDVGGNSGGDHNYTRKSSACSSNSETSKGSGLSLSRSESRMKARERAKERTAEKKEKGSESTDMASLNPISHTTFTELLSGVGVNHMGNDPGTASPGGSVHQDPNTSRCEDSNFLLKSPRQQWCSTTMDYFTTGLLGLPASSGQMHLSPPLFNATGDQHHHNHQPELHHFSFVSENNLNFTISPSVNSSGLSGFNRGTLQSNSSSPSLLPHIQRFPDGSPPSFFPPVENYHQFLSGYDARLQHCYGDAHLNNDGKHSSQKGKAKS